MIFSRQEKKVHFLHIKRILEIVYGEEFLQIIKSSAYINNSW